MKNWIWYGVTALLIALDQASKYVAVQSLTMYRPLSVFPGLHWTLTYNSGSAFGFLNQSAVWWHPYVFTVFGVVMSMGLVVWMALCKAKNKLELLALSCILSGAIGNVIDRVRLGFVVDFIQVYYKSHSFPVFNIADSTICIGACLLFFVSSKPTHKKKK